MAPKRSRLVDLSLHEDANAEALRLAESMGEALLLQARILALRRDNDVVQTTDVRDAYGFIVRRRSKAWVPQLLLIVGSSLFGAFIPGFISEVRNSDPMLLSVYVAMGIVGIAMVFSGLLRMD